MAPHPRRPRSCAAGGAVLPGPVRGEGGEGGDVGDRFAHLNKKKEEKPAAPNFGPRVSLRKTGQRGSIVAARPSACIDTGEQEQN